ncbi:probable G-protein coupled receptor 83 [Aplysia californica]|uniref:Probable G-protein coupled receptor 83 n=1 Tax=Aplysia californica TaxID=6500 RepID=A0ABM1A533_APLCA|nr:probable G-protein coupled receptor 83 [Aplysia californica]XP_012940985.1 probable G-protein coupled receptor 83 [Aplysia californica]
MGDELPESIYNEEFLKPLIFKHATNSNGTALIGIDSQRDKVMPLAATVVLLAAYSVLCVISTFGNSLVCYVIFKNKRLHTATNYFIANLAISDLLVTFVNVPFNISRSLLVDWPFGEVPCHLVNYSLVLTCYVSTYTLTSIALDRHRVVLKPLSRRMSRKFAVSILILIWAVAICLSLPYGMYMRVLKVKFLITTEFRRCRFIGPKPWRDFEKFLTVTTFILQYCVPFSLIAIAYGRIVQSLWARTHVGAVTANQQLSQAKAKRKSIKLLIAVVIVFAICWLPLNMYHLLTDLHPKPEMFQYNTLAFFACHWVAISSTCYNPFVYCWLNENFREEVKSRFSCLFRLPCGRGLRSDSASTKLEGNYRKVKNGQGSVAASSVLNRSVRRDPNTTATEILKNNVCSTHKCKECDVMGVHNNITPTVDDDDMNTDFTDEAAQGLILTIECNGQGTATYQNGIRRI